MLPELTTAPRDDRAVLGAVYRLLASELAAIKAKPAEHGTSPVDETGPAAEAAGGMQRDDRTRRNLPS